MARAAQITDVDPTVPMIEEQIETGLQELLENYRPTYVPGGAVSDELDQRFLIHVNKKLPQFNHAFADAFEASDKTAPNRQIYAMVCNPNLPYRQQALNDASGFANPNLQLPLASGTVRCSHLNESRFVIFFDRPHGSPVSQLIASGTRLHESKVITNILEPAVRGLLALREHKIHHGNIRPEIMYIGDGAVLGECYSAPSGTLAHWLYESGERLMADPMGHGEADEKSDVYSLAVLAYELMFGLDRLKNIPRDEFIARMLTQGSYALFANNRDFPSGIQDFFRGTLTDNLVERWSLDQVLQFINGKRFNMIAPSVPKDAARPFIFLNENILSRRLLAHMLQRNWRETTKDIKSLHLERWCETSLHRPEVAESMERALRIGSDHSASERQVSDMMTRIFTVLDPVGPLRSRTLSLRPDSIPLMYASLAGTQEPELDQLYGMIESDVCSFWSEHAVVKSPELSLVIWRLQRVRPYLKMGHLGFGPERALYELNPSLPCQSPLFKPFHITSAAEALQTLDVLAKGRTGDNTLVDRHIAAFVAAKIDLRKPIRLNDLTSIMGLHSNQELIMLRILAKAQQKHSSLKLVGLCAWAGMHTEKMINEIHNRVIRKQQKLKLKKRAASGVINDVLMSVLNREVGDRDTDGFTHAIALHEINYKRIQFLKNPLILEYKSRKLGGQMATTISYSALGLMAMSVITKLLGA